MKGTWGSSQFGTVKWSSYLISSFAEVSQLTAIAMPTSSHSLQCSASPTLTSVGMILPTESVGTVAQTTLLGMGIPIVSSEVGASDSSILPASAVVEAQSSIGYSSSVLLPSLSNLHVHSSLSAIESTTLSASLLPNSISVYHIVESLSLPASGSVLLEAWVGIHEEAVFQLLAFIQSLSSLGFLSELVLPAKAVLQTSVTREILEAVPLRASVQLSSKQLFQALEGILLTIQAEPYVIAVLESATRTSIRAISNIDAKARTLEGLGKSAILGIRKSAVTIAGASENASVVPKKEAVSKK